MLTVSHASAELACGDVALDTRSSSVTVSGKPIDLTAYEFRALAYLMHKMGQVVSRTELAEHVYAQDLDRDSNTIEVFVGRLRRGPMMVCSWFSPSPGWSAGTARLRSHNERELTLPVFL